jgi:hypothetical protein
MVNNPAQTSKNTANASGPSKPRNKEKARK